MGMMIVPNTRAQFTYEDLKLISKIVWHHKLTDREAGKLVTDATLLNKTLDDKRIIIFINELKDLDKPSQSLYIYSMVRHALLDQDVTDDVIADYLSALIIAFGQKDRAWKIDDYDDEIYNYIIDLRKDGIAEHQEHRQFRLHVHLGNFALWLSGIFPKHVTEKRGQSLRYFDNMGQTGFIKASLNPQAKRMEMAELFEGIADQYLAIRMAFNAFSERTHIKKERFI